MFPVYTLHGTRVGYAGLLPESSHLHNLSSRNNVFEAHFFRGSESFTYIISSSASSSVKKVEGRD